MHNKRFIGLVLMAVVLCLTMSGCNGAATPIATVITTTTATATTATTVATTTTTAATTATTVAAATTTTATTTTTVATTTTTAATATTTTTTATTATTVATTTTTAATATTTTTTAAATTTTTAAATTTTTAAATTTTTAAATVTTMSVANDEGTLSVELDPTYTRLLLVNAENPLPKDFNNTDSLVSVPKQYCNGSLYQVDKDIYPYVMAMAKAAWAEGIQLYVRSPYRSYATQKMLFQNKVNKVIANGTPQDQAEAVAATAVARPGTSEHQTGLAIDFNTASYRFETLPACDWIMEHGEEYGFILRYPKDKTDITGVMYEPWHWRFVGINAAKEINQLGVTLEEYVALKNMAAE